MSQSDEPPQDLPGEQPVPITPDDIDEIRDALRTAILLWEYREERSDVVPDQWWELAQLANAFAIAARATSACRAPLRALHRDDQEVAADWKTARWQSRWGRLQPWARNRAARLTIESLSWGGVLEHLAADEELAAAFQDLTARFLALRASGQDENQGGPEQ